MDPVKKLILYLAILIHTVLYVGPQILLSVLSIPRLLHQHVFHDVTAERRYRVEGAFAIVTGATDGIGKAFVEELAMRGWNIIIHGRSRSKVATLIDTLSSLYPKQTFLPFIADASVSPEQLDFPQLLEPFQVCNITLLINNVGGLSPVRAFAKLSDTDIVSNIHVNVSFGVCLTRHLLNLGLLAEKSCILNLGSIGSVMTLPGTPTYSASKAFTTKFTACLRAQLQSPSPAFSTATPTKSIELLSLMPGGVRTGMTPIDASSRSFSPLDGRNYLVTPRAFAKAALGKMGLGWTYKEVYPCWRHELQMGVLTAFPEEGGVRAWVNAVLMRRVDGPRAEGWRKMSEGWRMVNGKLVGPVEKLVDL